MFGGLAMPATPAAATTTQAAPSGGSQLLPAMFGGLSLGGPGPAAAAPAPMAAPAAPEPLPTPAAAFGAADLQALQAEMMSLAQGASLLMQQLSSPAVLASPQLHAQLSAQLLAQQQRQQGVMMAMSAAMAAGAARAPAAGLPAPPAPNARAPPMMGIGGGLALASGGSFGQAAPMAAMLGAPAQQQHAAAPARAPDAFDFLSGELGK